MNPFFKKSIASGNRLIITPVISRFKFLHECCEVSEHHFSDGTVRK